MESEILTDQCETSRLHRESVSGEAGFSLGGFDRVLYCKFKFGVQDSETLRTTLPWPIAVVKWYKINAFWYKPDPPGLGGW